jgi:hypothetical protein
MVMCTQIAVEVVVHVEVVVRVVVAAVIIRFLTLHNTAIHPTTLRLQVLQGPLAHTLGLAHLGTPE